MRCFIAMPLPDPVCDRLEEVQKVLRAGRPVPRENLHLTLAFLDDQSAAVLEELHDGLSAIRVPPFDLRLAGLGVFGGSRPRVLHAEAEASPALSGLHRRVRAAARMAGIELPRERFRPHVTLARFGPSDAGMASAVAWAMRVHGGFTVAPFTIREFALLGSTLMPDGPVYEVLADYPLAFQAGAEWDNRAPEDV
ncbi:MAG: RNA 2',3'-cyclic phosphodiesterase [Rhodobacteraceae bacterium]|nr:RNA 2',3'-cyclic phosphodiesterase [Paracoccaceae bacterium]